MLDFMRRQAQGWIVKVLFGLIVLSFVFWGVGDYFSGSSSVTVATVGDQEIAQQELENRVRSERNRLREVMGDQFSPGQMDPEELRREVLQDMIRERLLQLEAHRLGLTASDEAVRLAIQGQPAFQQGGEFSTTQYESVLGRMGLGPSQYESRVRQDLAVQAYQGFFVEGTLVAEEEVWDAYRSRNEERRIRYGRLAPEQFLDKVTLEDAEVEAYYEEHQERYRRPARAKVEYVVLTPKTMAEQMGEPDADELRSYYEDNADRYTDDQAEEAAPFEEVRDQVAEDWRREQAEQEIYDRLPTFQDLLYTREDLTAAAEEFGLEMRTSPWIPREGDLPDEVPEDPDFREAAFDVAVGENSEDLELEGNRIVGLHVLERQPPSTRPLEEVREEVRQDLRQERARELARERAEEIRESVDQGESLADLLEDLDAEVEESELVTRSEAGGQLPGDLAGSAFGAESGAAGVARVGESDFAVYQVEEVIQPDRDDLEEEQLRELRSGVRLDRGEARMEAVMDQLRQRHGVRILKEGGSGDE
ncbi:MAG: SurA N-terminal domain-containing protein [Thiohalorhabdus sp.]